MPRLMSMPARSSWAMRFAIIVCASMVSRICDKVIDERSRCDNVIGGDYADRDNMFCRHDHGVAGHRDHRIEVTCRKSIRQVTRVVGQKSVNQREIGTQRRLQEIALSVDVNAAFALFDNGANARWRKNAAQPITSGPNAFN